jgi:hypothetical protein
MKARSLSITITDTNGRTRKAHADYEEPLRKEDLEFQLGILARTISREPDPQKHVCTFCDAEWSFTPPWHEPTAEAPRYCQRHRTPSSRAEQPVEQPPVEYTKKGKPKCPTPKKRAFPSEFYASRWALKSSGGTGHGMRVYRCTCGKFHITKQVG